MRVRVLQEGRGRLPRQGLQLRRAWPGKEGKAFSAKQGPRKPDTALLGPWGGSQRGGLNTFPLEITEGKWANGHEGYLPGTDERLQGMKRWSRR